MMSALLALLWLPVAGAVDPAGALSADADDVVLPAAPADNLPVGVWNGTKVGASKLREVVSLYVGYASGTPLDGGSFCSGTLIHPEWVLTAAHCVSDVEPYLDGGAHLWVGFGAAEPFDNRAEWYDWHTHPRYNPSGDAGSGYDIALIRLVTPRNDEPTMPVNRSPVDTSWIGLDLTLAGFGVTDDGRNDSGTKRQQTTSLIRYDGDLLFGFNGSVGYDRGTGMYYETATDSTSNVCQGDSGGPTLARDGDGNFVLVAVSVIVTPSCQNGGSGSTRTDLYMNWIESYVDLAAADEPAPGVGPTLPDYSVDKAPEGPLTLADRGAPVTPDAVDAYPVRVACAVGPVPGAAWWVAGVTALGVLRRRRR